MNQQVLVIHGGENFETYDEYINFLKGCETSLLDFRKNGWKKNLEANLGTSFDVYNPEMPNSWNARYEEWRIWFEKALALMSDGVILVGHSLGGVFLPKYLSENKVEKTIRATMLVSAPFRAKEKDYSLVDFVLPESLKLFDEQGGEIYLYHSEDDMVVPFDNLVLYEKELPRAHVRTFADRGHFLQESFPELEEDITKISQK